MSGEEKLRLIARILGKVIGIALLPLALIAALALLIVRVVVEVATLAWTALLLLLMPFVFLAHYRAVRPKVRRLTSEGSFARAIHLLYAVDRWLTRVYLTDRHPLFILCLADLAMLLRDTDDEREESVWLDLRKRVEDQFGARGCYYGLCLLNLGRVAERKKDWKAAATFFETAVSVCPANSTDHRERDQRVSSLVALASLYRQLGRFADSQRLSQEALQVAQSIRLSLGQIRHGFFSGRPTVRLNDFSVSQFLGDVYLEKGDWQSAEPLIRIAFEKAKAGTYAERAQTSLSLGALFRSKGDEVQAESHFLRARQLLTGNGRNQTPLFVNLLTNLASLYFHTGRLEESLECLQSGLDISRDRKLAESEWQVLKNLVFVTAALERHESVLQYGAEALSTVNPASEAVPFDLAGLLLDIGRTHYALGQDEEAEKKLLRALDLTSSVFGPDHIDYAVTLFYLGLVEARRRSYQTAWESLLHSAGITTRHLLKSFEVRSEQQRLEQVILSRTGMDAILSLLCQRFRDSREHCAAAFEVTLKRKGLTIEILGLQRQAAHADRDPVVSEKFRELNAVKAELARVNATTASQNSSIDAALAGLLYRKETIERELSAMLAELLPRAVENATPKAVADTLPANTWLVEYVLYRSLEFESATASFLSASSRYAAFLLGHCHESVPVVFDLGAADEIDQLVVSFRRHLDGQEPVDSAGTKLREQIWDPIARQLPSACDVWIAPDAQLCLVPFAALPLSEARCLLDHPALNISYINTGRDVLSRDGEGNPSPGKPVVVASPDFDLSGHTPGRPLPPAGESESGQRDLLDQLGEFHALDGSEEEGRQIADRYGVEPWLHANALKKRLKEVRSPRILHLATHGFFIGRTDAPTVRLLPITTPEGISVKIRTVENPMMRSGLALAGANSWLRGDKIHSEAEDGLLTAEDVTGMDLRGTRLVVLSACDTALGDVLMGEGVFGLRRAFIVAGAETVIMSLWRIGDAETAEFMFLFYEALDEGHGCAEALRRAQREFRRRYSGVESPSANAWGAFICQGHPGPLTNGAKPAAPYSRNS